jgi:predicted nucleic-acid-binding Zn-ribbon protein
MKKFNPDSCCTKCGSHSDAYIEYKLGIFSKETQSHIDTGSFGATPEEYILRTCSRCGYKWAEECLNLCE